ncbi:MAG: succinate dehydrogenase [Candidatus Dormibacteria bacterium]
MATQAASPPIGPAAQKAGLSPWAAARRSMPWWALPVTVVTVLSAFSVYAIWTAFFSGGVNQAGPYLSPFYSPLFWTTGPITPALWVLWSPLLFRATCYYYRKAYYRSFFWDPPACTLGELRHRTYRGEAHFPLFLNNMHRFFLYAVLIVTGFLWYDVFLAFFTNGCPAATAGTCTPGPTHVQLGLGTGIMLANVILLSGYTFGCHSLRHLVGGGLDCYAVSKSRMARHRAWSVVSVLNGKHAVWAWISMFSVVITDIYIHLLRAGVFPDPHVVF